MSKQTALKIWHTYLDRGYDVACELFGIDNVERVFSCIDLF